MANGCFFFSFLKESCATGRYNLKPFERLSDSRSTCTAHHMRCHCCPRRNQHCRKSLESWLIGKTEIFRDELSSEQEHGCRSCASPGCVQLSPSFSPRAQLEQPLFFFFIYLFIFWYVWLCPSFLIFSKWQKLRAEEEQTEDLGQGVEEKKTRKKKEGGMNFFKKDHSTV